MTRSGEVLGEVSKPYRWWYATPPDGQHLTSGWRTRREAAQTLPGAQEDR